MGEVQSPAESPRLLRGFRGWWTADRIFMVVCAAVGAALFVNTFLFPSPADGTLGPAGWPRLVLFFIVAGAIRALFLAPTDEVDEEFQGRPRTALVGAVAVLAYTFLLPYAGYLPLTFVFLLGLFLYLGKRERVRTIVLYVVVALVLTAALFLLFDLAVGVRLPSGPLERLLGVD